MTILQRDDWYDIARDVDWTLSYVDEKEAFPEQWSGIGPVPKEAWAAWDEPYRCTYRDYVSVQRDKESGAHAVREALLPYVTPDGLRMPYACWLVSARQRS